VAQAYQKLVQEDLNIGTEAVWVKAPGGGEIQATQVGIHSFARGLKTPLPLVEVEWVDEFNVDIADNRITKNFGSSSYDAGAVSTVSLASGDGYAVFRSSVTIGDAIFGLGVGDTDQGYADVDFGLIVASTSGSVRVIEAGTYATGVVATYAEGDELVVSVSGGAVLYYHNGTLLYTSAVAPTYPLVVDTSLYYEDSWVEAWTQGFAASDWQLYDQKAHEAAWTPGVIAAGSNASTTVTVAEAAVGDFVMASHDKMLTNALRISGHVSASDTVKVIIHNPTAAAITVAAGTVRVAAFPAVGVNAGPTTGSVSGTIYLDDAIPANVVDAATVEITAQSLTDTSTIFGTYSFPTVTPGSVTVDASKVGYIPGSNTGTVTAGNNTVIDVVISSPV
jgi:hypothetical protein